MTIGVVEGKEGISVSIAEGTVELDILTVTGRVRGALGRVVRLRGDWDGHVVAGGCPGAIGVGFSKSREVELVSESAGA